ncbi:MULTISPECIES: MAPEG family protein [unclassified Microcoleus]|uniref:MAPEG family protein n=1 Tax=unclassified Microcoleus TaxID=2642155 RepID=UPI002FD00A0A
MINLPSFNQQQQIVVWRGISAFIFCLTFVLIGYYVIGLSLPLFNTPESRLIFTLRCQIFPLLMLFAGIVAVGNGRFSSPAINPLANAESEAMRINVRYLSNTLEQFVLFFVGSLILSTFLDTYSIKLIPILATLFVFGRIAFWIGYLKEPIERAFGLGVTLYPTIAVLIYDAYRVLFFNS